MRVRGNKLKARVQIWMLREKKNKKKFMMELNELDNKAEQNQLTK
jgi:hypothetical protein